MSEFAGALRERIVFERPGGAPDPAAAPTGGAAWYHDGAAWAAVEPLGPGERIVAGALSARPRWRLIIRARDGLDLDSRVLWRGRILRLVAIEADPRTADRMLLLSEEQP